MLTILVITGFLEYVNRQEFLIQENTTFWKLHLFASSGEGRVTPTLLSPLERTKIIQWTTHVT
jgi:hypothetical protein